MPPEVEAIMKDPQVIEGAVAVLVGLLALLAALLGLGAKRLSDVKRQTSITKEQVTNNHDTNLRDDLTYVQRSVTSLRDDVAALTTTVYEGFRRMDHQFGETHDRLVAEKRERQNLDERAREEHKQIWQSIREKD